MVSLTCSKTTSNNFYEWMNPLFHWFEIKAEKTHEDWLSTDFACFVLEFFQYIYYV